VFSGRIPTVKATTVDSRYNIRVGVVFPQGSPCVRHVSWVDSNSLRLVQLITDRFQDGGSKPEVVKPCTILSQRLDFSIDSDCPRHIQCGSFKSQVER